jgi:hypothetical protein
MKHLGRTLLAGLFALSVAGSANAANIAKSGNISTSETWTSDNVYNLEGQIYVLPGATLTIEAGTLIQSDPADGGSLAITRGAKIYVNGTKEDPVIMTSTNDNLTDWHEGVNEWGNLTVMGDALISASHYAGYPVGDNTKTPTGLNEKQMEGLTDAENAMYGGDNDNDDSGAINYLNLRYGGKVIGLNNELNGLSLGAIGRATDISHVDIMNNVDDGIEIWGGTVNLKYVSIWNIGDDSFDIDEGWRGKAQFGLIVQGYGTDADQGSGVGDNCFETDGAEDSDAQPVTTGVVYNFTVIGQPAAGDGGTTWRDNARMQYRNMIFMDLGEKLVRFDGDDDDGANGYGYNGTLSWEDTWTTSYAHSLDLASTVNACDDITGGCTAGMNEPADMYTSQVDGNLAEIKDSVFFRNQNGDAYTESTARGVHDAANNNVTVASVDDADAPIVSLTRAAAEIKGGKTMLRVTGIDPRANNEATSSVNMAPADGFFTPAPYRGGFSPDNNWLCGWTAASAYGITTACDVPDDPAETIELTATAFFQTEAGVLYTVEESTDNVNWTPVTTVEGDGTMMSVTDLDGFDSAKFYRAIVL